jgi:hypothetical protein
MSVAATQFMVLAGVGKHRRPPCVETGDGTLQRLVLEAEQTIKENTLEMVVKPEPVDDHMRKFFDELIQRRQM